jgi:hypothetical protein
MIDGKYKKYDKAEEKVFLSKNRHLAVVRTTRDGKPKSWFLTGYKKDKKNKKTVASGEGSLNPPLRNASLSFFRPAPVAVLDNSVAQNQKDVKEAFMKCNDIISEMSDRMFKMLRQGADEEDLHKSEWIKKYGDIRVGRAAEQALRDFKRTGVQKDNSKEKSYYAKIVEIKNVKMDYVRALEFAEQDAQDRAELGMTAERIYTELKRIYAKESLSDSLLKEIAKKYGK